MHFSGPLLSKTLANAQRICSACCLRSVAVGSRWWGHTGRLVAPLFDGALVDAAQAALWWPAPQSAVGRVVALLRWSTSLAEALTTRAAPVVSGSCCGKARWIICRSTASHHDNSASVAVGTTYKVVVHVASPSLNVVCNVPRQCSRPPLAEHSHAVDGVKAVVLMPSLAATEELMTLHSAPVSAIQLMSAARPCAG